MTLKRLTILLLSLWMSTGCEPDEDFLPGTDATLEFDSSLEDVGTELDLAQNDASSNSGCSQDDDCGDPNLICFSDDDGLAGVCGECLDNTYCPMDRPYCGLDGLCSTESQDICRDPLDCQDPNRAQCLILGDSQVGTCVECRDNSECVQPRPFCSSTGVCVGSQDDVECEPGTSACGPLRICTDGECVER